MSAEAACENVLGRPGTETALAHKTCISLFIRFVFQGVEIEPTVGHACARSFMYFAFRADSPHRMSSPSGASASVSGAGKTQSVPNC